MYCPETIKVCNDALFICHHGDGDVHWKYRPLRERINPLRYEIGFIRKERGGYRFYINKDGRWQLRLSEWLWRLSH